MFILNCSDFKFIHTPPAHSGHARVNTKQKGKQWFG
jgi:hypothetical protein